jgi:glycosyltransferase involved in cell wall biosynthesis
MISVIIPTDKDPYIYPTIKSLLDNAEGDVEVISVLDNFTPDPPIKENKRVRVIRVKSEQRGMRAAINTGIAAAKGEFIMKCDCHCLFAKGYDRVLSMNCAKNWLMIPRRYSLDENKWERINSRPVRDYHYLTFPTPTSGYGVCISNQDWLERAGQRSDSKYDIDDTMTFQGSCWFANKNYFLEHVGFLDDRAETYGTFADEPQEIGLKYWLGGGENKIIKTTWYAHLSKQPRHYKAGIFSGALKRDNTAKHGRTWSAKHWMNNEEPNMIYPLSWLVEKFWPVPTWPEDRKLWIFPEEK